MRFNADSLTKNLLSDLSTVIDTSLTTWSIDSTPTEVACYRLKESLTKKLCQTERPSPSACEKALKKFEAINSRLEDWTSGIEHDWEAELYTEFKNEVYKFWYRDSLGTEPLFSDYLALFEHGRAGPGASLLALGEDLYTKMFCSPLSATKGLPDIWDTCITRNPQFMEAYCHPSWVHGIQEVSHNNLSFVNKTTQIARTICTEPTINMWFQLGLGSAIERRLISRYNVDLRTQPDVNRRLATLGSIQDHLVTIDLESASDSMSLRMLHDVLPKSFMAILMKLRSPSSRLPDGRVVNLNMVSTMGNGFTFPLQTMLFSAAVVATYRYLHKQGSHLRAVMHGEVDGRNFAVFGDDIIVDKRIARHLVRLLSMLGFVVNSDKTYFEGPFRESCGVDSFLGVDVRPFYLKKALSLQDSFVAINGLNLWSAKTGVPLRNTVQYLLSVFPRAKMCMVPPDEDDSAGLHVPRELLDPKKFRENSLGHIHYVKSMPCFYGYRINKNGESLGRNGPQCFNPLGLYIAFLYGSVRGYRVSLRQRVTRYITKHKITPNWGTLPPQTLPWLSHHESCTRFLNACVSNL
jgi:hypothetical protein